MVVALTICMMAVSGFTKTGNTLEGQNIKKNETVYVVLNHDGSVKNESIVNLISGLNKNITWTDYGSYKEVYNMTSESQPVIGKDSISWKTASGGMRNFYYQGITDKELPVEISIKYFLDGKEVKGEELAGKTGDLKIIFRVKNKTIRNEPLSYINFEGEQKNYHEEYYVPFLTQISLTADMEIFSDIVAEDAMKVVTGEEMTIGFASYPFPEEEFIVEMYGREIKLEPFQITVIPSEIPSAGVSETEESLVEMADGVSEMKEGADEIIDGLDEMIGGAEDFRRGSVDLVDAISGINHGIYTLNNSSGDLNNGFSELLSGTKEFREESIKLVEGVNDLKDGSSRINSAINESSAALSYAASKTGGLADGADDISQVHDNLVALAQSLVDSDPGNATYQQLLAMAQGEKSALGSLSGGIKELDNGLAQLSDGFAALSGQYGSFGNGISELADGIDKLPGGIEQFYNGQSELYKGFTSYSDAVSELYDGTQTLYDETKNFPEDSGKLIDGIIEIRDGIIELNNDGIIELKKGVVENINSVREGKALEDKLNTLAGSYTSFADSRNVNSSVQFIMQTGEIKPEDYEQITNNEILSNNSQNLWQKIVAFFKKFLN